MTVPQVSSLALIVWMCTALVVSLLGFMNLAGVLPQVIAAWSLSSTEAGWLGGVLFAGYVSAAAVLTGLTDRIDPKRIYLASAALAAFASFALAAVADGFWSAMVLRFLTGVGIAGTHMPGLKGLTDRLEGTRAAARGVTYYTAIFALGSGVSILIGGEVGGWLGWRAAFWVAGAGAVAAFAIVAAVLPWRPPVVRRGPGPAPARTRHALDFRPVLCDRRVMAYVLAGIGAAWEVFASRVWFVTYFAFLAAQHPDEPRIVGPTVAAFLVSFCGVPASMALGELATRFDRRRLLLAATAASVAMIVVMGASQAASYNLVVVLGMVFGMTSFGRTAANTGGTVATAPPELRGAALAVLATVSFSGGIVAPLVFGMALDAAGGIDSAAGWTWAFLALAIGPLFGFAALSTLAPARPPGPAVADPR